MLEIEEMVKKRVTEFDMTAFVNESISISTKLNRDLIGNKTETI